MIFSKVKRNKDMVSGLFFFHFKTFEPSKNLAIDSSIILTILSGKISVLAKLHYFFI